MTQIINHCHSGSLKDKAGKTELDDILRSHINDYQLHYKLHPEHYKVVADILECRTSFLGGHIHKCSDCKTEKNMYNSCRNRHCPKCQTMTKARWLEARKAELLPVQYFHSVFTLPHEINPVALCNKRVVYGILFKAVSETLLQFGKNPKNGLEGKLGVISILHTWDQKLNTHLHLHCVIPGGVLSFDNTTFKECGKDFLFPVMALSKVFRGKFMELLSKAFDEDRLTFPGRISLLGTPNGFKTLVNKLWKKNWIVYTKKPFSGPDDVLGYIARYTHRVAISNNRILNCQNGKTTFTYRNRKTDIIESETLESVEFIRRFLLHVIPKNFMRIRHYGLFANRNKTKNVNLCRKLLGYNATLPKPVEKNINELMLELTGKDITLCPFCKKGTMEKVSEIPKLTGVSAYEIIKRIKIRGST